MVEEEKEEQEKDKKIEVAFRLLKGLPKLSLGKEGPAWVQFRELLGVSLKASQ